MACSCQHERECPLFSSNSTDKHPIALSHVKNGPSSIPSKRKQGVPEEQTSLKHVRLLSDAAEQKLNNFLAQLIFDPKIWRERQKSFGFQNTHTYESFILSLIELKPVGTDLRSPENCTSLYDVFRRVARFSTACTREHKQKKAAASFTAILLAFFFLLLRNAGYQAESLRPAMQEAGIRGGFQNRVVGAAKRVRTFIQQVHRKGLHVNRATEFLLLNPMSPTLIWESTDEHFDRVTTMMERSGFITYSFEECLTPVIHIPYIIHRILDKARVHPAQSMTTICTALDFQIEQEVFEKLVEPPIDDGLITFGPKFETVLSTAIEKTTLRATLEAFFVECICSSRSLLKTNFYSNASRLTCTPFRAAMYALSASYIRSTRRCLIDLSMERDLIKKSNDSLGVKFHVVYDTVRMILLHHAILNPELYPGPWTQQLYEPLSVNQASVVVAAHTIWLNAFLPLEQEFDFQTYQFHWLQDVRFHTEVHSINGCSGSLLYMQNEIRKYAIHGRSPADLIGKIELCEQTLQPKEDPFGADVSMRTAKSYRYATILYAYARALRTYPSDERFKIVTKKLVDCLCDLPWTGKGYTGLHPAWCFLVACASTETEADYCRLLLILEALAPRGKSNVSRVLTLFKTIWDWKKTRTLTPRWWEELTMHCKESMEGVMICVS